MVETKWGRRHVGDNVLGKTRLVKGSISGSRTEGSRTQKHDIASVHRTAKCLTPLEFEVQNREYWERRKGTN